ncbi:MAG: hypothetical protein HYV35_01370 [Lentisphaerae bacterium]|nr:hypothetical protein [Lentisphaerota bacterium]
MHTKKRLLLALILMALGGFLLHLRIHPFAQNSSNLLPIVAGLISIIVIPALFSFRKTIAYGYVLNGLLVIVGTIVMAHYAMAHKPDPLTWRSLLIGTTLADILVLWGKFFIGQALFDLEMFGYDRQPARAGRSWRYPNLGWWFIHLLAIAYIYALGNIWWR